MHLAALQKRKVDRSLLHSTCEQIKTFAGLVLAANVRWGWLFPSPTALICIRTAMPMAATNHAADRSKCRTRCTVTNQARSSKVKQECMSGDTTMKSW